MTSCQGLHATRGELAEEETYDEEHLEESSSERNSDVNLGSILKYLQQQQVNTILLDEARLLKHQ